MGIVKRDGLIDKRKYVDEFASKYNYGNKDKYICKIF